MTALGLYVLDERGVPVPCGDLLTWGRWFETADRSVARTLLILNGIELEVSTVFLGMDHNLLVVGPPVLWETMVFGPDGNDEYQRRHASHAEALEHHGAVVENILSRGAAMVFGVRS